MTKAFRIIYRDVLFPYPTREPWAVVWERNGIIVARPKGCSPRGRIHAVMHATTGLPLHASSLRYQQAVSLAHAVAQLKDWSIIERQEDLGPDDLDALIAVCRQHEVM